ncbi:unnamed protein product [Rhodiola kirilowii]
MGDGDKSPSPPSHPPPAAHHHNKIPGPKHSPPHHYAGDHDDGDGYYHRHTIAKAVAIFLLLIGLIALIVYLIYRPEHPQFTVSNASIYGLNSTAQPFLSASFQFTILLRNPNKRVSIHYERFTAYVTYHDQPITPITRLPPLHQRTRSLVSATPVLGGTSDAVPVSAEVLNGLAADEAFGVVELRVVVVGRLRWKAGAIKTSWKWMTAMCDVIVGYRGGSPGQVPLLSPPRCHVKI